MSELMKQYAALVPFLGEALGKTCEVVLQDVKRGSIAAISNGEISNRKVGSPLTNLALKMIASEEWKNVDYVCNYTGVARNERMLRSSTFFIKEDNNLVGMLCINVDTSEYKELSNRILELGQIMQYAVQQPIIEDTRKENHYIETFSETVADVTDTVIREVMGEHHYVPAERLTQEEKLAIVEKLNDKGAFLLKGAVSDVAASLACSEATIYRYLSKIQKEHK